MSKKYEVVGYYPAWNIYDRDYEVHDIAASGTAEKLTVINYAFGNVRPIDGRSAESGIVCQLGDPWADYQRPYLDASRTVEQEILETPRPLLGNFQQLKALKETQPHLKVLISLGGWTWSKWFSDAALTEDSRALLIESCIDLFIRGNLPPSNEAGQGGDSAALGVFDGIDIDWEYPAASGHPLNTYRPEDRENFTLLLAEFREALDRVQTELDVDTPFMLTVATAAGPKKYEQLELDKIHDSLDFINVMTYDFHGGWDNTTNFHSNLFTVEADPTEPTPFSVDSTIQGYLVAGVPSEKLVMGLPFYGRGWTAVSPQNNGLFQAAEQSAPASLEPGFEDYKRLVESGLPRFWQEDAKMPFLFDGETFWGFDDPESICHKMAYIHEHQLGGAMFWELSGDTSDGVLAEAIDQGLNNPAPCDP